LKITVIIRSGKNKMMMIIIIILTIKCADVEETMCCGCELVSITEFTHV
jgi:hypothetical protein